MGWVIFFLVVLLLAGIGIGIWQMWEYSLSYSLKAYDDENLTKKREELARQIRYRGEERRSYMHEEIRALRRYDREIRRRRLNNRV